VSWRANIIHQIPTTLLEDARLGSPRVSPWRAGRPVLVPLRPCRQLGDTGLQAIGSLVGTLPGAPFCAGPVDNPEGLFHVASGSTGSVCDWVLLAVMLPV
jgi:hypothetical protein